MTQATAESHSDDLELDGGQYLTFQLSGEVFGIDILGIREIISHGRLTTVPMVPSFIAGVINLRGAVVPVINLAIRFGVEPSEMTKKTSIVIIETEQDGDTMEIGIIVDAVNEVLTVDHAEMAPPPSFGAQIRADFISSMARTTDGFLILLDAAKVLSIDELSTVSEVCQTMKPPPPSEVEQSV